MMNRRSRKLVMLQGKQRLQHLRVCVCVCVCVGSGWVSGADNNRLWSGAQFEFILQESHSFCWTAEHRELDKVP